MSDIDAEQAKLRFQFTTILDLGKFMYDSYFKLATMSFALNGLLLGSVSFLLPKSGQSPDQLNILGMQIIGIIGLIYNLGALSTYLSLVRLTGSLVTKFEKIDASLQMDISSCRSKFSDRFGYAAVGLTIFFFLLWLTLWISLLVKLYFLR